MAAASGSDSLTVGNAAAAEGESSTALGNNSQAKGNNSVALGNGSVADRDNSVTVGLQGNERQVTNVAAGTQDTDAVNVAQLNQRMASVNSYADTRVQALSDSFDMFKGEVDQRFINQDRRIDRQGAMSAAMMNMATSTAGIRTENRVGVGVGYQNGESALSVGYQRAISDRATITIGGAFSSNDRAIGARRGFGW